MSFNLYPRKLYDYDVRTDGQPVYVGQADAAALTTDNKWVVQKYFYDTSNRVVDIQLIHNIAWTNRATAAWKASGGDA